MNEQNKSTNSDQWKLLTYAFINQPGAVQIRHKEFEDEDGDRAVRIEYQNTDETWSLVTRALCLWEDDTDKEVMVAVICVTLDVLETGCPLLKP